MMNYYLVVFYSGIDGKEGEIRDINCYDNEEAREEAIHYYNTWHPCKNYKLVKHNEVR